MKKRRKILTFLLFLFVGYLVECQYYLRTIAGNGIASSTGDGGPPSAATVNQPTGVWTDSNGNLYIGEVNGYRVRRIDASGSTINTVVGIGSEVKTGAAGPGATTGIDRGYGIYGDDRYVYISGFYFVWKYDTVTNIVSRYAGALPAASSYSGDGSPATSANINVPRGIFLTSTGVLYVADRDNHRVRAITAVGIMTTFAGSGSPAFAGDGGAPTAASLNSPRGVWGTTGGVMFIADTSNNRVRKVSGGIITTFAGTGTATYNNDNIPANSANLNNPSDVKGDTSGNIYIAEYSGCRIRRVNPAGIITTIIGTGICAAASTSIQLAAGALINSVFGIWVDTTSTGTLPDIYYTEYASHYVRYVYDGTPTAIPTAIPTNAPTLVPTSLPTTVSPSRTPSAAPSTTIPTATPSRNPTAMPSEIPTATPTAIPSVNPTAVPTATPTKTPTAIPTALPTTATPSYTPTETPTAIPTKIPTKIPTAIPTTASPTSRPSSIPTKMPSSQPSSRPSSQPTLHPTRVPSSQPSSQPTGQPTGKPSSQPSRQPSSQPSNQPSSRPTRIPTSKPSSQPTGQPSRQPSSQPTGQPTLKPSGQPTNQPSSIPTKMPSSQPSSKPSCQPSSFPSSQPSMQPSSQPSSQPTSHPTNVPSSQPSSLPTGQPSRKPSSQPSSQPTSSPSRVPTCQPSSCPSSQPSGYPSVQPSSQPSSNPTSVPSSQPSSLPTGQPSRLPSSQPSDQPSSSPTRIPSSQPSSFPSGQPSSSPSSQPSRQPSTSPTVTPSSEPSSLPSSQPTCQPSSRPSGQPSSIPTSTPSSQPSCFPTSQPSCQPSNTPSSEPSAAPSMVPSSQPSSLPTSNPSVQPSSVPSSQPSAIPSRLPSSQPSRRPTSQPTSTPSMVPSSQPSCLPSSQPTSQPNSSPTSQPTSTPSMIPSSQPSCLPSSQPSSQPSGAPSSHPSAFPSSLPSSQPTIFPTSQPSTLPTSFPSSQPSSFPSGQPSSQPSSSPTSQPVSSPSMVPSSQPSSLPTIHPSSEPSNSPSSHPSSTPSRLPSSKPSSFPTSQPSSYPSIHPSSQPTSSPSKGPSSQPSSFPSGQPTSQPSTHPSSRSRTSSPSPCFPSSCSPSLFSRIPSPFPTFFLSSPPTMFPTPQFFSFPTNLTSWKSFIFLFGVFSSSQQAIPPFSIPSPSTGSNLIIFGNRQLSSFEVINTSSSADFSFYPMVKTAPAVARDVISRASIVPGDINLDGFNDIIVCYPVSSICYIYFGTVMGLRKVLIGTTILGPQSAFFGFAVDSAGDVNQDGFIDLIISAVTGRSCSVIYGRASWPSVINTAEMKSGGRISEGADGFRILADESTSLTGMSVAGVGDMNGDGKPDLAVSVQRGLQFMVYLIWGEGSAGKDVRLSEVGNGVKGYRMTGEKGFYTGLSISQLGDVNGDGFADVVIGAMPVTANTFYQKSYVIFGMNETQTLDLSLSSLANRGVVVIGGGFVVSGPGDLNGDGIDEIIVTTVSEYVGKGNAYIISYPDSLQSPPSLFPTSQPSSSPSCRPTCQPSSSVPTSSPSSRYVPLPVNETSRKPTFLRSRRPSASPTFRPSIRRTSAPSTQRPNPIPTRRPSTNPTRFPTFSPTTLAPSATAAPSFQVSALPIAEYQVRYVNITSVNSKGTLYGADGVNEIFDISSKSRDGTKMSGWSGTIVGGRGRKIYRIYLKDPTQPVNKIILKDFDSSKDIIDLSLYPELSSIARLTYQTVPLTIIIPDNQLIVLPSHSGMDLDEKNFIFHSSSSDSSDSSSSISFTSAAILKYLDTYMVLGICLVVPMLIMVGIFYFTGKDKGKMKRKAILPELATSISHGSDAIKENLNSSISVRLAPIYSESESKDDDDEEGEGESKSEELDIGFSRPDSTDSNSTVSQNQREENNLHQPVEEDKGEDNPEDSFDENVSYDFESFSSSMSETTDVFEYHRPERVLTGNIDEEEDEDEVEGENEEHFEERDEEQSSNSLPVFILTWDPN